MSTEILAYVVRVAVRIRDANRADARLILMLLFHVSKQTFAIKIRCSANRASVSASIDVLYDLISRHYCSLYGSLISRNTALTCT